MTTSDTSVVAPLRKPVICPTCRKSSKREFYPFCSKRCQDVDLHKWFSGTYAFEGSSVDDVFEET